MAWDICLLAVNARRVFSPRENPDFSQAQFYAEHMTGQDLR